MKNFQITDSRTQTVVKWREIAEGEMFFHDEQLYIKLLQPINEWEFNTFKTWNCVCIDDGNLAYCDGTEIYEKLEKVNIEIVK